MGVKQNDPSTGEKVIVSENEKLVCYAIATSGGIRINIETDAPLNRLEPSQVVSCLESLKAKGIITYTWAGKFIEASLLVKFDLIDVDRSAKAVANRLFKPCESMNDSRKNLLPFLTPEATNRIDFLELRQMVAEFPDWVRAKLQALDYKDFLLTPYWAIVSDRVKNDCGNSCVLCGCKDNLEAHHRTYCMKGVEILDHLKTLTCLCGTCHSSFHNNSTR